MKSQRLLLLALLLMAAYSCQKQDVSTTNVTPNSPPAPGQLDQFIQKTVLEKGEFLWAWASDEQIWTALSNSDYVLSIGYKPAGEKNIEQRLNQINVQSAPWQEARQQVLDLVLQSERLTNPVLRQDELFAFQENGVLPFVEVYVRNPATISLLRASAAVRYAEPIGYEPFMTTKSADRSSGSGCGNNNGNNGLVVNVDYTNVTPGCKQSWNHTFHKVNQAWNNSTGAGVTVMWVDTGASDDQENLGDDFAQGFSGGRNINKLVTLTGPGETPHDQCGHGTAMIGAGAAPRGSDGAAAGIAYGCNVVSVRAASDVYLDDSNEVNGVSSAFTLAGNMAELRIVSMSMGRLTTASQIKDAIQFAHQQGKMIFCAAGTSFWWTAWFTGVIFPASMPEAIAVTGIKDNLTARCSDCHSGSKVDFVVVMQKNSNGRNPLSLAMSGDVPSTVGGSSVATASTAGMAALVWAKYPGWSRQQVFDRLKTSSNYFPTRHSTFGWGRINAQLATN